MPARYEGVPVWNTHGRYRKGMKRGYNRFYTTSVTKMKLLYQS